MSLDVRAPWHHYLVLVACGAFYLFGTADFLLTTLGARFYLENLTQTQAEYFIAFPRWITGVWALATAGGLAGTALLALRNRYAVLCLFLAFAALAFLTMWMSLVPDPRLVDIVGFSGLCLIIAAACIAFLFYSYARWERTRYYLI